MEFSQRLLPMVISSQVLSQFFSTLCFYLAHEHVCGIQHVRNRSDRHKSLALASLNGLFFNITEDESIRTEKEVRELLHELKRRLPDFLQPLIHCD